MRTSLKIALQQISPLMLSAILAISLMAMGQIKSNLTIPAKQAFELGGGNRGTYKVKAENRGVQVVKIFTKADNQEMVAVGEVKPGETKVFKIGSQTTTILKNESIVPAKIFAVITGDTNLGMSYYKLKNEAEQPD